MKDAGDHDLTRLYDGAKASWTEGVALALVNPAASGGQAGRIWPRLLPELRSNFPELTVELTDAPGAAGRIARAWCQAHPGTALLVAGGDGTLHEAVNGAEQASFRLGVIPLGSGNDFARNAGIPLDPRAAVRRLSQRPTRTIDLGQLSCLEGSRTVTRVFLNSLSLGLTVRANALARSASLIPRGRLRYGFAGLRAAWSATAEQYSVRCEARSLFDGMALNLTVANGASFGGGMRISPDSSPSDAILELIVLRPMRRLRLLAALAHLQRGTHLRVPELSVIPVRGALQVAAAAGPRVLEADGEAIETSGALTIEVLPGKLTLLS